MAVDTDYAMTILQRGGYFLHRKGHVIVEGEPMVVNGFRTYLYDENGKVCLGPGVPERWSLWDQGLLIRTERMRTAEVDYEARYDLKELDHETAP